MILKGPSQPPQFSMPSKLLILHGEVKSECFTIGCVSESMFNYLQELHSDFLCFIIPKLSHVNKNKDVADKSPFNTLTATFINWESDSTICMNFI